MDFPDELLYNLLIEDLPNVGTSTPRHRQGWAVGCQLDRQLKPEP